MVNRGGAIDNYKSRRRRERCPLGSTDRRSCRQGPVEETEGGGWDWNANKTKHRKELSSSL